MSARKATGAALMALLLTGWGIAAYIELGSVLMVFATFALSIAICGIIRLSAKLMS